LVKSSFAQGEGCTFEGQARPEAKKNSLVADFTPEPFAL
jgi:hypothetical protein